MAKGSIFAKISKKSGPALSVAIKNLGRLTNLKNLRKANIENKAKVVSKADKADEARKATIKSAQKATGSNKVGKVDAAKAEEVAKSVDKRSILGVASEKSLKGFKVMAKNKVVRFTVAAAAITLALYIHNEWETKEVRNCIARCLPPRWDQHEILWLGCGATEDDCIASEGGVGYLTASARADRPGLSLDDGCKESDRRPMSEENEEAMGDFETNIQSEGDGVTDDSSVDDTPGTLSCWDMHKYSNLKAEAEENGEGILDRCQADESGGEAGEGFNKGCQPYCTKKIHEETGGTTDGETGCLSWCTVACRAVVDDKAEWNKGPLGAIKTVFENMNPAEWGDLPEWVWYVVGALLALVVLSLIIPVVASVFRRRRTQVQPAVAQ